MRSSQFQVDTTRAYNPKPKIMTGGVSVIIPFRGKERLANLRTCLQFLQHQSCMPLDIIVVEESPHSVLAQTPIPQGIRVVHIKGQDKFNKSIAINAGALLAAHDVISIHDVDLILPSIYFEEVATELYGGSESCFLLKEIFYLFHRPNINRIVINQNNKRSDYFNGGSVNIRKDAFMRIGGMNEKFYGYGHEDCEFWTRVQSLTKLKEDRKHAALHLYHKRPVSWSENTELYEGIMAQSMETRLADLQSDLEKRKFTL
jgi:glycosyltransferase involved in cell wall biosynthesis